MPLAVGVSFKSAGRVYSFDPNDLEFKLHDQVKTRPLGPDMRDQIERRENDALKALPTSEMNGLLR